MMFWLIMFATSFCMSYERMKNYDIDCQYHNKSKITLFVGQAQTPLTDSQIAAMNEENFLFIKTLAPDEHYSGKVKIYISNISNRSKEAEISPINPNNS